MSLPKLPAPMKGYSFWISRILFHFNFSRTGYWSEQTKDKDQQKDYLFSAHLATKEMILPGTKENLKAELSAFTLLMGPFKFSVGALGKFSL